MTPRDLGFLLGIVDGDPEPRGPFRRLAQLGLPPKTGLIKLGRAS